jgi:SAM-dependent methyltransferase
VNGSIAALIASVAATHRSILDYGCGVGRYLPLLSASFEQVVAADYSGKCVAQAQVLTRALSNVRVHTTGQLARHQAKARFDVVLMANVLLHPRPPVRAKILDLALARLKPGGVLLLLLPAIESVHLSEAVRRSHTRRRGSAYSRPASAGAFDPGVIGINGQATKHYSAEEIPLLLQDRRLSMSSLSRAEYSWSSESFDGLDRRLEARPWDWLVSATRR